MFPASYERYSRQYDSTHADQDDWKPVDYGHPMRDDPTLVYAPPVLDPVHYGIESAEPLWPIKSNSPLKSVLRTDEQSEGRTKTRSPHPYQTVENNEGASRRRVDRKNFVNYLVLPSSKMDPAQQSGKVHLPRKPVVPHPMLQVPFLLLNRLELTSPSKRRKDELHRWNDRLQMSVPPRGAAVEWHPPQPLSRLHSQSITAPRFSPAPNSMTHLNLVNLPKSIDRMDTNSPKHLNFTSAKRPTIVNPPMKVTGQTNLDVVTTTTQLTPVTAETERINETPPLVESNPTTANFPSSISWLSDQASKDDARLARARARFSSFTIEQGHSKVKKFGSTEKS